jgi:hypothetical protein
MLARKVCDDGATQAAIRSGHGYKRPAGQAGVDAASLQPYWRS